MPSREFNTGRAPPAPGQALRIDVEGHPVAIFNIGGTLRAVDAQCGHRKGPLDRGRLNGDHVTCPTHGAQYDLKTGQIVGGGFLVRRVSKPIAVHEVRIEGTSLIVRLSK